jgi:hypothetical protein
MQDLIRSLPISNQLIKLGFKQRQADHSVCIDDHSVAIIIYVDDIALFGLGPKAPEATKQKLPHSSKRIHCSDTRSVWFTNGHSVRTLLDLKLVIAPQEDKCQHDMWKRYQEMVGYPMKLVIMTRLDIAAATPKLAQFLAHPPPQALEAVNHVYRYLRHDRPRYHTPC